jgi:hypothetical protein
MSEQVCLVEQIPYPNKWISPSWASEEMKECIKKAEILGKVFQKAGSPADIYSMFGVRP